MKFFLVIICGLMAVNFLAAMAMMLLAMDMPVWMEVAAACILSPLSGMLFFLCWLLLSMDGPDEF